MLEKLEERLGEKLEIKLEEKIEAKLETKLEAKLEEKLEVKVDKKVEDKFDTLKIKDRINELFKKNYENTKEIQTLTIELNKTIKITNENTILIIKEKKTQKNIIKYIAIFMTVIGIIIFLLLIYYVIKKVFNTNEKYLYIDNSKEQKDKDISNIEI